MRFYDGFEKGAWITTNTGRVEGLSKSVVSCNYPRGILSEVMIL